MDALSAFLRGRWVPIEDQMRLMAFNWDPKSSSADLGDGVSVTLNLMDREVVIGGGEGEEEDEVVVAVTSCVADPESETALEMTAGGDADSDMAADDNSATFKLHLQLQRDADGRERIFGRCDRFDTGGSADVEAGVGVVGEAARPTASYPIEAYVRNDEL